MVRAKKKPKDIVVRRRFIGLYIASGGYAIPQVRAMYEVMYGDARIDVERGTTVLGVPSPYDKQESRPELFTEIYAAAILNKHLEAVCLEIDTKRGIKEI